MKKFLITLVVTGVVAVGGVLGGPSQPDREPLYHESLRPQFHFTARYWDEYQLYPPNHHEGWINDLNGLVYNDGVYHLFAQRWWSAWLHAVSTDLIHWEELKPAFGKGGKFGGTQSGGGVVDWHNSSGLGDGTEPPMIAFWSSTDNISQCVSYSLDKGKTWTKYDKNPVLVHRFRDPKVFWYEPDQKWIMVLYGPSDDVRQIAAYGFNGESNDAHDLHDFTIGQWTSSAVRLSEDGRVVVSDAQGSRQGRIDITKQNIANEVFCVGAKANGSEFLQGDIAEILVYDRVLSEDETDRTLASLRAKWGLAESGRKGDISADGLVLRLDASNVTPAADGKVSVWKDLAGRGHDMTQSISEAQPQCVADELGTRGVIRFGGGQCLRGPAVLDEGDDTFTIVALWRRSGTNGSQVVCEQNAGMLQTGRRASLLTVYREESDNVYLLFSSSNLLDWTKLDSTIPNSFECPDMFELPVDEDPSQMKWVVIDGNGDYVIGRFDGQRFTAEAPKGKGDYGRNFYATMTFQNMPKSDPRRIQLAWMRGWDDYPKNIPFNQQISFPCRLTLRGLPEALVMCRYPIREIATLYYETFSLKDHTLRPEENPLLDLSGELFDINVEIDLAESTCSRIMLTLRGNTVFYDVTSQMLESVGSEAPLTPRDGRIELRVLMDRLSIETYGNHGEVSITNIAYQDKSLPHLSIHAIGGNAKIVSLTAHKLQSMWE